METDKGAPSLVIVRRRGSEGEEGHHGGMWKIAFADFMTAMMAFFLVMWLISVSDQDKLRKIAQHFNPLPMTSNIRTNKGVHEIEPDSSSSQGKDGGGLKGAKKQEPRVTEQELIADPEKAIDEILRNRSKHSSIAEGPSQFAGEDKFGMPWNIGGGILLGSTRKTDAELTRQPSGGIREVDDDVARSNANRNTSIGAGPDNRGSEVSVLNAERSQEAKGQLGEQISKSEASDGDKDNNNNEQNTKRGASDEEKALRDEIAKLASSFTQGTIPHVTVEGTAEGQLISLEDEFNYEMFGIGSAVPNSALVGFLMKLAPVLRDRKEQILVRGHTDGREFKSKVHDNWRLSALRAHIAQLVLVRGGVDKQRFAKIEGWADRKLKVPENPLSFRNRRIEILILRDRI